MKDGSLISLMDAGACGGSEGFCPGRFKADIVTKGLSYETLRPGMEIVINGSRLGIVSVGKPCHPDCPLCQRGVFCALKSNCAYGREKE